MSGEILREVRRKRRLWKKAKNGLGRKEYDQAAKKVKNLIRKAKRSMEKKLAVDKYQNSKPFYNCVKKKTTSKVAVGPLINEQGDLRRRKWRRSSTPTSQVFSLERIHQHVQQSLIQQQDPPGQN